MQTCLHGRTTYSWACMIILGLTWGRAWPMCSVAKYPDNPCLGHRPIKYGEPQPYTWLSYKEVGERVAAVAGAMMALGLKAHGRVGVYGINSPEWMMAMQVGISSGETIPARCISGPVQCTEPSLSSCGCKRTTKACLTDAW